MPCNPLITPKQKAALEKQVDHLLKSGDAKNATLSQLLDYLIGPSQAGVPGGITVKEIIVTGLKSGQSKDEIIEAVHGIFPGSKAGYNDIAYYKSKLKKEAAGPAPFTTPKMIVPKKIPAIMQSIEQKLAKLYDVDLPDVNNVVSLLHELKAAGVTFDWDVTLHNVVDQFSDIVGMSGASVGESANAVKGMLKKALDGDVGMIQLIEDVLGEAVDLNMLHAKATAAAQAKLAIKAEGVVKLAKEHGFDVSTDLFIDQATFDAFDKALADFVLNPTQKGILALKDTGASITQAAKKFNLSPFSDIENPNTIQEVIVHGLKQGKSEAHILADVKLHFPASKTNKNSVAFYKTKLKKAGDLPGYKGKSPQFSGPISTASPPAVAAQPIGTITPAHTLTHDVVFGERLPVTLGGSNNASLWLGKDGVKRVVKAYADPVQAYGEHLANQAYRQLGIYAPESGVFKTAQGNIGYWSKFHENATSLSKGFTKHVADKVLDGFAADILTANWDVVGLSMDNIVGAAGQMHRIDNGSAFLFRAQAGKRKPVNLLNDITEFEKFADGSNPSYAKVFNKAEMSPIQMGDRLRAQIDAIEIMEKKFQGWHNFVDTIIGKAGVNMPAADHMAIEKMLEKRAKLLYAKRATLHEAVELLQQRVALRAQSIAEVRARTAKVVDTPEVTALRTKLRTELSQTQQTAWGGGSGPSDTYMGRLKSPTALSSNDSAVEALQGIREKLLDNAMKARYGVTSPQMRRAYDSAIGDWYGSSNGNGAASLKVALEKEFKELRTSFHGVFINADPALRQQYLIAQVKLETLEAIREQLMIDKAFAKAYIREVMGKDKVTLYRGVRADYYAKAGVPKPKSGEQFVDVGNPMASWSFSKAQAHRFSGQGGVVMKSEVSVDDIASIFVQQPSAKGGFWSEKEAFVLGRPLHVTID